MNDEKFETENNENTQIIFSKQSYDNFMPKNFYPNSVQAFNEKKVTIPKQNRKKL